MRILVVGKGGREHALVRALVESPGSPEVYCFPGSDAILELAGPVAADGLESLVAWMSGNAIDLCIAGEESYLVKGAGLANLCNVMAEPPRIAVFGGTFDPVHLGHLHLAGVARQALALDEVRFMPCRISPHKEDRQAAPREDRLAMLRLAVAGLPWAVVEDRELRSGGVSYSYQTAEALVAGRPGARWFWIMGGDQWEALATWHHPERLAACVEFIVLARDGRPLEPRDGFLMHPVCGEHPASASAIREAFHAGATNHPWLPPGAAQWITRHRLYPA